LQAKDGELEQQRLEVQKLRQSLAKEREETKRKSGLDRDKAEQQSEEVRMLKEMVAKHQEKSDAQGQEILSLRDELARLVSNEDQMEAQRKEISSLRDELEMVKDAGSAGRAGEEGRDSDVAAVGGDALLGQMQGGAVQGGEVGLGGRGEGSQVEDAGDEVMRGGDDKIRHMVEVLRASERAERERDIAAGRLLDRSLATASGLIDLIVAAHVSAESAVKPSPSNLPSTTVDPLPFILAPF
jgi:hypothetical protein